LEERHNLELERLGINTKTQQFSINFNAHLPGGPELADTRISPFWILLALRMMEMLVTTGAVRRSKLQSNHHHQQTNTQCFTGWMAVDALSVAEPPVSEH